MSQDAYAAGDFVSADQYGITTPGLLLSGYGQETPHNQFHDGTLFHDAATVIIWAENQVSLGAGKTLMAKECFEQWLWELATAEICHLYRLSWQWHILSSGKFEDTFEDTGHVGDMSFLRPRTLLQKSLWPQSHLRTYFLFFHS